MHTPGEVLFYIGSGVCRIREITSMESAGAVRDYYVLSPVYKPSSTLYVPTDNPNLERRMVPLLTEEEIGAVLKKAKSAEAVWDRDFRRRSEKARQALVSPDRFDLLLLMKTVYLHKKELSGMGKALHTTDDIMLRDAENLIFQEVAYVTGTELDRAAETVRNQLMEE